MVSELRTLERVREINASAPYTEPLKRLKSMGKKIIGCGCSYVPEELIYAAGMVPVRLVGNNKESGLDEADAWLNSNTCSYERSRFQMVLDEEYKFLDGYVSTNMCDSHARTLDVWQYLKIVPFVHLFQVPQNDDEYSIQRYVDYFQDLMAAFDQHFGVRVTDEDILRGIAIVNRKRDLLEQISALRLAGAPPISGTEVAEVMNASFFMPADEFCDLLEQLLTELKATDRRVAGKFRIMMAGGPLTNTEFLAGIEALGGLIVCDELCTGTNYWHRKIELEEGTGLLESIANRYHNKIPCPRRSPFELRLESGLSLARQYGIDGMIMQVIRNCQPHGYHAPTLARHMEYYGFPVLQLEKEYGTGFTGQIHTRVQAFLESLEGRVKPVEQEALRVPS